MLYDIAENRIDKEVFKKFLFPDGFGYSFGVLLNPLMEYYGSDDVTISWASSLYNGLTFLFGPIIGGLANRFGLRPICISGGIVCCIGLSISTLSPNVPVLMITFGVIGGIGTGLLTLPANIAIGYYFESKRALATGITHCGSGVGQLILAPFMTHLLLKNYTWQTVVLIIAGFCMICAIFGVLIRPLEVKKEVSIKTKSIWDDFRHILIPTLRLISKLQSICFSNQISNLISIFYQASFNFSYRKDLVMVYNILTLKMLFALDYHWMMKRKENQCGF
jgi:MFS family permease